MKPSLNNFDRSGESIIVEVIAFGFFIAQTFLTLSGHFLILLCHGFGNYEWAA
jgi:hypothetical protein